MADATIDGGLIILYDNWPGPIEKRVGMMDNPDGDIGQNVAVARYDIGSKIMVKNSGAANGTEGPSIFTYLQVGTQHATVAIAAKIICVPDSATNPYVLTNDKGGDISVADGLCAIALCAMTNAYYGWFLTGGVVPSDLISGLDGTFPTDDSVVAGDFTTVDLTADAIGFGIIAATTSAVGYSVAAD